MPEFQKLQDKISFGGTYPPTTRFDTYPSINLTNRSNCSSKAVLITGANKGIGFGIALSYAGGGQVASAITEEIRKAATDAGRGAVPEVLALIMDVMDSATIKKAAQDVETHFGRLDILVYSAGFLAPYDKILDGDENEWWQRFSTNLRGGYLIAKAFLPLMLSKGGDKTTVTISSTGVLHFHQGASSYQISKFVLLRLMEFIMAEYADQRVLAYSIHPGGVTTDLASKLPQGTQTWLKRSPALNGDTIAFLTSERQEWPAGRYLTVIWDMDEFFAKKQEIVDRNLLKMRLTF
ncbi:NAD(P)-binding protein [Xylaria castorea]|nr:NAD(P)-binding protein [Xylaria castorea]